MLRLLERSIAALQGRLLVVAPRIVERDAPFTNVVADPAKRWAVLREVQRVRGAIYLHDGALQRHQLSSDGRHHTDEDERSWHLLFLNRHRRVSACVWYLDQGLAPVFDRLRVLGTPPMQNEASRDKLFDAVQSELCRARRDGLAYAEVGGWAVAPQSRCTSEGLLLALGAYSLGRLLGGSLGMTTATVRHASSSILRRLGGSPLESRGEAIPAYYDPKYRCMMELLRFDSRYPNAKYAGLVDRLCENLVDVPVISASHQYEFGALETVGTELAVA